MSLSSPSILSSKNITLVVNVISNVEIAANDGSKVNLIQENNTTGRGVTSAEARKALTVTLLKEAWKAKKAPANKPGLINGRVIRNRV